MPNESHYISSITIGTPQPKQAAEFYSRLLGWPINGVDPPPPGVDTDAGWAQVGAPAGTPGLMRINLEYEREYVAPVWPSRPDKQHVTTHLDIPVHDLAAAVRRAEHVGARLADFQPQDDVRVLLDPFDHPFCLFQA